VARRSAGSDRARDACKAAFETPYSLTKELFIDTGADPKPLRSTSVSTAHSSRSRASGETDPGFGAVAMMTVRFDNVTVDITK
jgi:hypothetical protein